MRVLAQPAFVLHARPWRETSVIVELLTREHGRVGVVARGLTTAKKHPLKAALQPLQFIRVDYEQRGELARLGQAEALDHAPALQGERLMAMFYVNELLLRLTPRNDAAQPLFDLYARIRGELAGDGALAWALRRFERDLLESLGVGLPWDRVADGEAVEARGRYRIDPELGPVVETRRLEQSVGGEALLALVEDREPGPEALAELRLALREMLQAQLGATGLRSWGMLEELARIRSARR
jgi:DNA repair protein RecO (recombination protein O)